MTRKILFLSPVRFDGLHQRHQAFAELLSQKDFAVFYLNPVGSNGFSINSHLIEKNLRSISISVPFKASNFPALQRISVKLATMMLKKSFKLHFKEMALWVADPSMAAISEHVFSQIIYDRCDLHGSFPGQKQDAWKSYEAGLFSRANLVSVSHKKLLADIPAEFKEKSILAANACSANIKIEKKTKSSFATKAIQVVSSGAHFEWVDFNWLQMFANNESVTLNIAGTGRGKEFNNLLKCRNVVFHGKLKPEDLTSLLYKSDVGLIPFADMALTAAVDPIKAYEYAATGLQVWSPRIAGLENNPLIDQFIDDKISLHASLDTMKKGFNRFEKIKVVPRWPERLNSILDRLPGLSSD